VYIYLFIYYLQLGCHPVAVHIYTQTVHRTTQITTEQREQQNMLFMFNYFSTENRAVYEKMCENMVDPDIATDEDIVGRMLVAY
jgi:uncharacterized integral membrane protein